MIFFSPKSEEAEDSDIQTMATVGVLFFFFVGVGGGQEAGSVDFSGSKAFDRRCFLKNGEKCVFGL